jgi:hypothetical protein
LIDDSEPPNPRRDLLMFDIAWFPLIITVYGIAGIVCCIAAYIVAQRQFRDRESWAFCSFFVPPVFFLLLWLGPSSTAGYRRIRPSVDEDSDDEDDGDGVARNAATRHTPL